MINIKKIIPFKKDIEFESAIEEVTSISLDHEFNIKNNSLNGTFVVSGEYKTDNDIKPYKYDIPFSVDFDESYILDKAVVDIDDFYYETDKFTLKVSIDVLVDNLDKQERCIEEEDQDVNEIKEDYKSYTVYIVRESD